MPDDPLHTAPPAVPGPSPDPDPGAGSPADGSVGDEARARARHLDLDALSAVIDGALPPADAAAAEAHLASCSDCSQDLAELRATVDLLGNLPLYEPRRSFTLGPEHARGRSPRRAAHPPIAAPTPTPTLPASRPAAGSAPAVPAPADERGWGTRLLPNVRVLQYATAIVAALFVLATAGDLLSPTPDSAPRTAPQGFFAAPAPGTANEVAPAAETLAPAPAPAVPGQPPAAEVGARARAEAADGTDAAFDASQGADGTRTAATQPNRASPWRVAQLALGLVLLWLVVSLAGRLIIDRHERMPG